MKKAKVIWQPQPKQIEFMQRPEYEALYGGAAGGGKSDALLAEALRQVKIPNYRAIIFRDTTKQLEGLISRSEELYKNLKSRPKYNHNEMVWKFPSGAKIFFGYMQYEKDKLNYQGKAYDFIGFDELTHFTYTQYTYLMSRNRPVGPNTRVYIRATTNPGGKGMQWVKDRFITPAPPLNRITDEYKIVTPNNEIIRQKRSRIFVPSSVFDNPALLKNDPNYLATLAALPDAERKALLYGDWSSFEGQVFTEFTDDPAHYEDRKWTHVIEPFSIPKHWKIYRGYDFGYAKPFSVAWYAVDEYGKIYRFKEYYGCTGTPNVGLQISPVEQAKEIRRLESEDPNMKDRKPSEIIGIADPSIFDESRGESIAAMMARNPNYVYWNPGDNNRLPGKMQFHYRFAFDEDGDCMFQVFNTCRNFIRTVPNLIYSATKPEDIDTDMEDHVYDECRYVLMEHPISRPEIILTHAQRDDPLDMFKDNRKEYKFYRI